MVEPKAPYNKLVYVFLSLNLKFLYLKRRLST